jgi:hypothetical protein
MRRISMALALALVALAIGPGAARALVSQSGDDVSFAQTIDDLGFFAGGRVHLSGKSTHDIFAAGGRVEADGAGADHLILAGGEIDVTPGDVKTLIAAGGRTELRGGVLANDLIAAGGIVSLRPEARVGGSAVVSGGVLKLDAPIGRALTAAGGRIELNAPVGGEVRISGRRIDIGPLTRIGGDLYVRGETITIAPGAVITGKTIRQIVTPRARMRAAAFFIACAIAFLGGALLLPALIATVLPGLVQGAAQRLQDQLAPTMGIGALIVLVGPVLVGVLLATIIGAPGALFLVLAYLAALAPAFATVAYWLGQFFRSRLAAQRASAPPNALARFGWTLLGALVLSAACLIPILGGLVWLAALVAGVGAVFTYLARGLRTPATA